MIWRTGRTVGRTIYIQQEWEPRKGDRLIGLMDSVELAELVCDAVNDYLIRHPDREITPPGA